MDTLTWKSDFLIVDEKICKKTVSQIVEDVKQYGSAILENFDKETLDVYLFLKERLYNNVSSDLVFQFVFRSFYRIDNAGLHKNFKTKYFEVFEKLKNQKICFQEIDKNLERVSVMLKDEGKDNAKSSLQFSFTTKMVGLICDDCPIYDSEVARVFGYDYISNSLERPQRLDKYIQRHVHIYNIYREILDKGLLKEVLNGFKQAYGFDEVHEIKLMDFIFWQAGKETLKVKKKNEQSSMNYINTDKSEVADNMSM